MKYIVLLCIIILIPFGIIAQVKSFELTNPLAIELTDSAIQKLTSQTWRVIQVDTDVRGKITETEGRRVLKYNEDGTFTYRHSGTWEIIDGKYIDHSIENEQGNEVNFGGIYAVVELSSSVLTLTKILTSSYDMVRTMYFEPLSDDLTSARASSRLKPIFSAPINYYKGKTDPISLDSISKLSMEELFMNQYLIMDDTIYLHTPDSLYRLKRLVQ